MASGNDWQTQPRDPETGQWGRREYWEPRNHEIKIRLTYRQLKQIRAAASAAGMTLTGWILHCCDNAAPRRSAAPSPEITAHQKQLARRLSQNRRR